MEQDPQHNWLRIQCPKCETRYRIERSKIPETGATIRCRKCQHKLVLKRKIKTPSAERPDKPADRCPKCGFEQKEGEFCYKCGTRIRQLEKKAAADGQKAEIPMGLIEVDIGYNKTAFYLNSAKPVIEFDKEQYVRSWGRHQFQIPPGRYAVKCYIMIFGRRFCEKTQMIELGKNQYIHLRYTVDSGGKSRVKILKTEDNAGWHTLLAQKEKPKIKSPFMQQPVPVIFLLVTAGPMGLYYLWKSPHFSQTQKWVLTAGTAILYIYILQKFKLPSF